MFTHFFNPVVQITGTIINRFNNGESVSELTEATGVARSTIYGWIKAAQSDSENEPVNKKTVNNLESKVIRLSTLIEILQKVFDVENMIYTKTRRFRILPVLIPLK